MASKTENVKLGVCRVIFDGNDLGYTKGGVEVEVTTETHSVEVDQFGRSPINEYVLGRSVMAKVPLAETTLDNLVRIMPGATMIETGGAKATGTITFADVPSDGDTVTINGVTFTAKTTPSADYQFAVGASATAAGDNLVAAIAAVQELELLDAGFVNAAGTITVTFDVYGTDGNAFTLAKNGTNIAVSGAMLTGGANSTGAMVSVPTGIGIDLLSIAKKLVLHPKGLADNDRSEDFVIPKAMTPGALQFSFKLDEERIYNVQFKGYPDSVTERLFIVGDEGAE